MPRARLVDFDYYEFTKLLRRATAASARLEPTDTSTWKGYVQSHGINEVAAMVIARRKFDDVAAVIIAEGLQSDGLYLYSTAEEACLRLVMIE